MAEIARPYVPPVFRVTVVLFMALVGTLPAGWRRATALDPTGTARHRVGTLVAAPPLLAGSLAVAHGSPPPPRIPPEGRHDPDRTP